MDQALITRIVEAALLAAQQPLTLVQLRGLFTLDEPAPEGSLEQALDDLRAQCIDRGIELVETASGYRFQVQADVHAWVARLWTERQTKYTRATLETLAIIAYRQPITRGEIEQVRGVAVSSNIIKALEEREWIRSVGHRDVPGRPELLGTTRTFLDYFGLKSLDQLPPLSELKDFGELDPQLTFEDPDAPKPGAIEAGTIVAGVADEAAADASDDAAGDEDASAADPEAAPQDVASSGITDPDSADSDEMRSGAPHPDEPRDADAASGTQHDALVADDDSTGA